MVGCPACVRSGFERGRSCRIAWWFLGFATESTKARDCLAVVREVNGKGTRMASPCLQLVIASILFVVPEPEGRFAQLQPAVVFRGNAQGLRKQAKELVSFLSFECPSPDRLGGSQKQSSCHHNCTTGSKLLLDSSLIEFWQSHDKSPIPVSGIALCRSWSAGDL